MTTILRSKAILLAALFLSAIVVMLRQNTAFSQINTPNEQPLKRVSVMTGGDLNNGIILLTVLDVRIEKRELLFGGFKITQGPKLTKFDSANVRILETDAQGNAKELGKWAVFAKVKVEGQEFLKFAFPKEVSSDGVNLVFLIEP